MGTAGLSNEKSRARPRNYELESGVDGGLGEERTPRNRGVHIPCLE